jgi:hypothetical protein
MSQLIRVGPEQIKAGFDMFKEPYFALYEMANSKSTGPGNLLFSYRDEDKEGEGWKVLKECLQVAQHTSGMYMIRFYEVLNNKGTIDSNTPYSGSFKLRMNDPEEVSFSPAKGAAPSSLLNDLFASKLELFDMKWQHKFEQQEREHQEQLADLEAQLEEKETEGSEDRYLGTVGEVHKWGDVVGELGNKYPWMRDIIVKFGNNVNDMLTLGKYKIGQQMAPQQPQQRPAQPGTIGAIKPGTPEERMNMAIIELIQWYSAKHGDISDHKVRQAGAADLAGDLELLVKLSQDDDMMELALKKLRNLA